MIEVFAALKGLLKADDVSADNWVFRAHTRLTVLVLFGCSLLVTSRQYFGHPISCVVDGVPKDVMEAYCWVHSTFTLPGKRDTAGGAVRPGVGPYVAGEDAVQYHNYYQWVGFVLFLQALAFYAPRYAWRLCEGGRVRSLVPSDGRRRAMVPADVRDAHKKLLLEYFAANVHSHGWYATRFFACELLNAANAVAQALFMDVFFGGQFTGYGAAALLRYGDGGAEPERRDDPISRVFPKVTKCTFHKFGASGTVQRFDGLCVLALNALNEKIFVFLWFYLCALIAISVCALPYRVAVVVAPRLRAAVLKWNARHAPRTRVDLVVRKCHVGDWFVLCRLAENVDELLFGEFLCDLADYLDAKNRVQIAPGQMPDNRTLQFISNNIDRYRVRN